MDTPMDTRIAWLSFLLTLEHQITSSHLTGCMLQHGHPQFMMDMNSTETPLVYRLNMVTPI